MREITSHKVNGLNECLTIGVHDEPGPGNACHQYSITGSTGLEDSRLVHCEIKFQNGPITETGVNGVSNEALLAILEDRMVGFQNGPYVSEDNANALFHIRQSMYFLKKRTLERIARGVEGTHQA